MVKCEKCKLAKRSMQIQLALDLQSCLIEGLDHAHTGHSSHRASLSTNLHQYRMERLECGIPKSEGSILRRRVRDKLIQIV